MALTICTCTVIILCLIGQIKYSNGVDAAVPILYPPANCTLDGLIQLLPKTSLAECRKECNIRKLCRSINYHRISTACALRHTTVIPNHNAGPPLCVNVEMNSDNSTLDNTCSVQPCDNSSVCILDEADSSHSCKTMYCVLQPAIQNANLRSNQATRVGQTNSYVCDDGFTPFGNTTIECQTDGNWTTTDFFCYPNCPNIPIKLGAEFVSLSAYRLTTNTTVKYSCRLGYYNLSYPSITCKETGDWSDFECTPKCHQSEIPKLTNGFPFHGNYYTIYMRATYSCNEGYYLSPGSPSIECDQTGKWTSPTVECYKHCMVPSLGNAYPEISIVSSYLFVAGDKVTFRCEDNHYAYPLEYTPYSQCYKTGAWEYAHKCYRHCGGPPSVSWAYLTGTSSAMYTLGTTAMYQCSVSGLSQADNLKKTCDAQGNWNGGVHCCAVGFSYDASKDACIDPISKIFG